MPSGIEVRNPDNTVQFSVSTRLLRVLTPNLVIGTSAGSITVPNQGSLVVSGQTQTNNGDSNSFTTGPGSVSWSSGSGFEDADILVF